MEKERERTYPYCGLGTGEGEGADLPILPMWTYPCFCHVQPDQYPQA